LTWKPQQSTPTSTCWGFGSLDRIERSPRRKGDGSKEPDGTSWSKVTLDNNNYTQTLQGVWGDGPRDHHRGIEWLDLAQSGLRVHVVDGASTTGQLVVRRVGLRAARRVRGRSQRTLLHSKDNGKTWMGEPGNSPQPLLAAWATAITTCTPSASKERCATGRRRRLSWTLRRERSATTIQAFYSSGDTDVLLACGGILHSTDHGTTWTKDNAEDNKAERCIRNGTPPSDAVGRKAQPSPSS